MINLNIQPIANQTLSGSWDGINNYEITLKSCGSVTAATITRSSATEELTELVSNIICVAGTPLLPYGYLENGNFMFLTLNDELPNYTQFGATQQLIYASEAELEAIYASS